MTYLLDTNVVSEVRRPRAAPEVVRWIRSVDSRDVFLSALVLGEIRSGIERLVGRDPAQAAVFERWLDDLRREFGDRTIPVDPVIADEWGRLTAARPLPVVDGLMAATAKVRGMVFVTRNVRHVAHTGVRTFNPWDVPPA